MKLDLKASMIEAYGISEAQLQRLVARSPHAYKVYTIPKKSGGVRTIAQPAKEVKYLQRWLIENLFCKLPVHECATAYKDGASIKINASRHQGNQYIAKFDFKNFFTSIKEKDLFDHLTKHFGEELSEDDVKMVARLSCISVPSRKQLCLSIGAPSSPFLSNSVMYEFDCAINCWCREKKVTYTRYADDLTFSTNEKGLSSEIEPTIRAAIRSIEYPVLYLNNKKTIHLSKRHQRRVTGVVINNEGDLSLGRERKRAISTLIHRFIIGIIADDEIFTLQGLLGFAKDIEPDFLIRMRKKYGYSAIDKILQTRKSSTI